MYKKIVITLNIYIKFLIVSAFKWCSGYFFTFIKLSNPCLLSINMVLLFWGYRTLYIFSNIWLYLFDTSNLYRYRTLYIFSNIWLKLGFLKVILCYRTLYIFSNIWLSAYHYWEQICYRTLYIFSNIWLEWKL